MKELRAATGITQGDLAKLIEVSQSMIARCESKTRMLDTAPNLRYLKLQQVWLDHQKKPKTASKNFLATLHNQDQQVRQLLSKQVKEQEYQIVHLNRLLQQQKERFAKARELNSLIAGWQQVMDNKGARIWLQHLALRAESELKHCSPAQQRFVVLQIKNAKACLANARDILRHFNKPAK